jgi:hypothetical protein
MKLNLRQQITQFAQVLQSQLFPILEDELGELTPSAKRLVGTLEMIPLARYIPASRGWIGRPSKDREAIARAFIAKAVYGFADQTTVERSPVTAVTTSLRMDGSLAGSHESTFRASPSSRMDCRTRA